MLQLKATRTFSAFSAQKGAQIEPAPWSGELASIIHTAIKLSHSQTGRLLHPTTFSSKTRSIPSPYVPHMMDTSAQFCSCTQDTKQTDMLSKSNHTGSTKEQPIGLEYQS